MELDPSTVRIGDEPGSTWNRSQSTAATERARHPPTDDWSERATTPQQLRDAPEQTVALMLEIAALEAEVEQKEQRLQAITQQYERLLSEKDEKLSNADRAADGDVRTGSVLATLRRYLPPR